MKLFNIMGNEIDCMGMMTMGVNAILGMGLFVLAIFLIVSLVGCCKRTEISASLKSSDGNIVAYKHIKNKGDKVIILAPGFYNNKETYLFKEMANKLSKDYDVICFDFRGHGKSSGLFTWTANEYKDLRAVVDYAKEQGYKKVVVMGFSLGAATTIIESSKNKDIDAVIAVSTPSEFWGIDYHFWKPEMLEDLKLNLGHKGKGKGIRPGNPFMAKTKAIDVVADIEVPILFVHGEKDWLINKDHSEKLYSKSKGDKKLMIVKGAGHAEKIYDKKPNEFTQTCIEWLKEKI